MRIEGSIQPNLQNPASRKGNKELRKPVPKTDTYVPGAPSPRQFALYSIKEKVRSGYYNSDRIAEDISEKLAKIFEDA